MEHIRLLDRMLAYESGNPKRIQHFLKVYEFARIIGLCEDIPEATRFILETAAIVHDIGIRLAEEKYGSCESRIQEMEGPAVAEKVLGELGYSPDVVKRVSYLVGHHHTYTGIDGLDYQILVEADFLVNMYEDGIPRESVEKVYQTLFRTKKGKEICSVMFLAD